MQLTPRQIRGRLEKAVAEAGSARAFARAAGVNDTMVGRCRQRGTHVPDALLAAAGMWRDAEGDVRFREPARIQVLAVQASGEAGVAAAVALIGAALGSR